MTTERNSSQDGASARAPVPGGLYALLSDNVLFPELFTAAAVMLSNAGVRAIQLRVKDELDDAGRLALQREVAQALAGWGGLLVVNDRADLAAILRAEAPADLAVGLHLGQDDLPPEVARRIVGPDVVIGRSTHTLEQVAAAQDEPVDYIGFGPLFATRTKTAHDPTVGLDGLQAACEASRLPVVAIGGVGADTAARCITAGAHAVAMAGALFGGGLDALPVRTKAILRELG